MQIEQGMAKDVHITYIGGGSRGWAWNLMSDLAVEKSMAGVVTLYDIDHEAAEKNVIIGNAYKSNFTYRCVDSLRESLQGADFVVISILPGTFDAMEYDVHQPEKMGIYQSVGDTTGPGGILRALRTMPMYVEIAEAIRDVAPNAWVINYTNPMSVCVRILYDVFPQIKAFGCCHEVFDTQEILGHIAEKELGVEKIQRREVKINVQGVNHFTWITEASYNGVDLMSYYAAFAREHATNGWQLDNSKNWLNNYFTSANIVKFDLFNRFGCIAAAGDRHLAEFCPGWYLKDPETANSFKFALTPVSWRKKNLEKLLAESQRKVSGEEEVTIKESGEEGVRQMKALLGLGDFVTNVNLPNRGQIPNVAEGVVVETNALFSANGVRPLNAGKMDEALLQMTSPHIFMQNQLIKSYREKSLRPAFHAFLMNPLVHVSVQQAKQLFSEMVDGTKEYLQHYDLKEEL